ncbi:MAG: stalk domain-containing protein, partial [Caldisericum sp.]|uniref:copper amine oxidase N-terminal domain-containing protein n=2 Tax=Caldisericum sp. TaxID=2499687 RepID=UPI003D0F3CF3
EMTSAYTNDQGVVGFDLTPGTYVIKIGDKTIFNAIIKSGKITKSDGVNVFPPSGETAPSAPSNLFAISISSSQINLTWVDNSDNEDGFKIERKKTGETYTEIKTLPANTTSYSDTGLSSNTTYYYRIRAFNSYGNSSYSNEVSVSTKSGDILPPNLTVTYPQQNAILNTKNFTITGTTDPGVTLTINNNPVSVGADGSFSYDAVISGPATFTIIAKDIAGNVTQFVLNVSLDTTPPILTVTEPHAFQEIYTQFVIVKGQTEKNAKVKINGVDITLNPDYSFSYPLQLTTQGSNTIEVIAEDLAGNKNTITIPITYKKPNNATTLIILQIGNPNAVKNDATIKLDAAPFIDNGRTMVPIRFISEAFGAKVEWEPPKTVTVTFRDTQIILQVGNLNASVRKKGTPAQHIILETPPKIVSGRTFVPIRFIGEAFGATVDWEPTTKTIKIVL